MEQAALLDMATQLLQFITPLIAQGAPAKLDEQATDAMAGLLKSAWDVLQRRLTSDEAQSALNVYHSLPQSKDIQALVAQQIVVSFKDDPAAIGELQGLLLQLRAQARKTNAGPSRLHTLNIGEHAQVGVAIAGDVHSRLTLGPIDFSRRSAPVPDRYEPPHQVEPASALGSVDLAVVTALQEELEPVLNLIGGREHWTSFTLDNFIHYRGQFRCGSRPLNVVACSLWKYGGNATTAQIVRLKQLRPRLIVMTGICAGWQEKDIRLGDVIVADRAFHGGEGKLTTAGFRPDIWTYQPPQWLLQWLKDFAHDRQWVNTITTPHPLPIADPAQPTVHYRAFASSEAVVAVSDPFTDLAKSARGIGALEMEVAALLSAALEIGVPAFAVKGVSDYGTPEKDDLFHTYAAEASARWMYAFICVYGHLLPNH